MSKPLPSKDSRSFLDKFEGKKNAISREGLLHLLDIKQQSRQDAPQPREKHKAILLREAKLEPVVLNPKESRGQKARSSGKDTSSSNPTLVLNQLQERYARMREELKQPKSVEMGNSSKVRLPAINKSSSHSTQLHKKNAETAPAEQPEGTPGQRMRSQPRRLDNGDSLVLNNFTKKMQLDKYALRHLEFLDKFEKQLLHNDSNPKKTSRSEYH